MAKKQKAKTKAEQPKETPAKPSEVRKVIAGQTLKRLLNAQDDVKTDVGKIRGAFGDQVKKAFEATPFDNGVFKFLGKLWKLTPERLAIALEDLEHGLEASGLNKRAADAPTLGLTQTEEADEDEETDAKGKSNVAPFPAPASVAAE